jgi:hypothetical protein
MDTCAYLIERYPEDFVHAISTGAYCIVGGRWDFFPILDVMGGRIEMAAIIYAVTQAYENLHADIGAIGSAFRPALAAIAKGMAEQEVKERVLRDGDRERKEDDRRREERDARWEERGNQPWRKRHR